MSVHGNSSHGLVSDMVTSVSPGRHACVPPRLRTHGALGNGAGLNVQANFSHGLVSDMVPFVSPGHHA